MAIGDVYKLSVQGSFGVAHQWVMTHHYRQELAYILSTPAEGLATAYAEDVAPTLAQILSANYLIDVIEVRQVTGGLESFDYAADIPGEMAGETLPPQICPLVKWSTGLSGRRNRGRSYYPAPPESVQDAGIMGGTYKTAVQNVSDLHLTLGATVDITWQKVVYGYPNPDTDPPLDENIVVITSAVVRNILATQRRRKMGVGS